MHVIFNKLHYIGCDITIILQKIKKTILKHVFHKSSIIKI
jgi:phosphopantetheinyl transferase